MSSLMACGQNSNDYGGSSGAEEDFLMPTEAELQAEELSPNQLTNICKAGMSAATGAGINSMRTDTDQADMVRISYVRDDGRPFAYDCRLEGHVVRTRMIDEAGPGTGPGNWSGNGSKATYRLENADVTIDTVFIDGSVDSETFRF
ncbi:hypothetical protein [Aurantiacibacter arachoides]|uniref:hypothetical protein n=1 Tax=Aurantiacibacter arachoides TaxID=1850444 RepID=UPI001F344AFB|nr:hypothetical protein [Aurantiacibacter arachoides]